MKYKNALVCGLARSGVSAAILLKNKGVNVVAQDLKEREKIIEECEKLEKAGVELYLGKNPDDIVEKFDVIVLSPGVPTDLPFVKKAEEKGISVISEVELSYSFCLAKLIGITGTNGKTTTTTLTSELIKEIAPNSKTVGNIGIAYSEECEQLTENDYAVAELSSFQLEKIVTLHPKISAILNITPDHLNRHKTIENYILAKEEIFKNQTKDDYIVLNYEDEVLKKTAEKVKANVIWFSSARKVENGIYSDGKSIYINMLGYCERLIDVDELNILGTHNVENVMASTAIALCANVPLENIRKVLKEFKAVEHRIEFVKTVDGVDYFNDSKGTNPDAAIKAIYAMKKPIVLIGGGYNKGSDFTEWIETFKGRVKFMAIIGEVSDKIAETCDRIGFNSYKKCDSFENAMDLCKKKAISGDCVLLSPACASWDMFESYEQRGEIFKNYVHSL